MGSKEGRFLETYKVRYHSLGEDHMILLTGCKNRTEALKQVEKMQNIGIKIWSVRKVKNEWD